ncbi:DUF92 domain-containing protein [Gracilimonas amylolytica]|uniref:DUF92 domain-containing protein n=1 Tax=Gracilimonas amylolytica TaxID=1749045 RepID=UPI000CD9571E|nr:DUF92 domain-containing protein [Gracilimonas amylolytica]
MTETKIFLQTPVNPVLDRWVNIFFSLSIIVVFTVYSGAITHQQILIGLLLAFLLTFTAFLINWLTIDGAVSATIFGMIAYGLGGTLGAGLVLAFFISGSILSKDQVSEEGFLEKKFRRDGKQVWANGFWFCLGILIWFFTKQPEFLVAASASLAATTSDTWATEIGYRRFKSQTRLITSWKKVEPGTDGGISFYGTLGGILGAAFIGILYWLLAENGNLFEAITISALGFLGCLTDSYIGARYQYQQIELFGFRLFGIDKLYVSNNMVNWISAGIATIISFIIILITGI